MSALSELLAETQAEFRKQIGVEVSFNGKPYTVTTEQVPGAIAGQQGMPHTGLGVDIASTAPRLFVFSPFDFKPYTPFDPPVNGNTVTWAGQDFRVTHHDMEAMSTDTSEILIYALRKVGSLL